MASSETSETSFTYDVTKCQEDSDHVDAFVVADVKQKEDCWYGTIRIDDRRPMCTFEAFKFHEHFVMKAPYTYALIPTSPLAKLNIEYSVKESVFLYIQGSSLAELEMKLKSVFEILHGRKTDIMNQQLSICLGLRFCPK